MSTLFKIVCKTHLHAGSGDSNYGVIDKLVQRDPSNTLPCIYASSLKGAMREYWENKPGMQGDPNQIFGNESKGAVIFHQATLISIPARSNLFPFFNVTAPVAMDAIIDQNQFLDTKLDVSGLTALKSLKVEGKIVVFNINPANLLIEDFTGDANASTSDIVNNTAFTITDNLKAWFGERIALVDDKTFLELCSDYNLPVIARNHLENGQSNNLWYEQIIPRESRFFFAITTTPGKDADAKAFYETLDKEQLVQIGANATIGYGQCLISKAQKP